MSKKFDIISIFLIIALVIILFFVIFSYFSGSSILMNTSNNNVSTTNNISSGENNNSSIISDNYIRSDDSKIDLNTNTVETIIEGENVIVDVINPNSGEEVGNSNSTQIDSSEPKKSTSTPLILSSDSNISNNEKKEVLKELDQTLMELLEVVDSVQTVDETRLIKDESEVQS